MALSPELLEILVCPESKGELVYFESEGFLFCPGSKLKYRIEDDIPVMLIDEAERRVCEAGYARLFVKVDRSNFEARRLYDRAGFKIAFVRTKRAEMKFGLPSSKQAQELFLLKSLG